MKNKDGRCDSNQNSSLDSTHEDPDMREIHASGFHDIGHQCSDYIVCDCIYEICNEYDIHTYSLSKDRIPHFRSILSILREIEYITSVSSKWLRDISMMIII